MIKKSDSIRIWQNEADPTGYGSLSASWPLFVVINYFYTITEASEGGEKVLIICSALTRLAALVLLQTFPPTSYFVHRVDAKLPVLGQGAVASLFRPQ